MFDSGFGGLTVARAVIDLCPAEDLVYLGDTARYPYGPRPLEQVRGYAIEIADYLVSTYNIKILVVACNTATAAALPVLRRQLSIPVLGVVEPGVRALLKATRSGRVGVIGTVGTIDSGTYDEVISTVVNDALRAEAQPGWLGSLPVTESTDRGEAGHGPLVEVTSCACPGLVEFIERGVTSGREVELLAQRLLAPIVAADVDALLLGCTHYPYLARVIGDVTGRNVVLVSSADETAFALSAILSDRGLLHSIQTRTGDQQFVSSGDVKAFTELGSRLLGPELDDALLWSPR